MKKMMILLLLAALFVLTALPAFAATDQNDACWGQASAVFAQTGVMGTHASEQPTPRLGLRNLARMLYESGEYGLEDDSMAELGEFVASSLVDENNEPITIEACQ